MQLGHTQHTLGAGDFEHRRFYCEPQHCHIIGATGTGKSTLIKSAIASDIEENRGLAFFTTKRSDFHDALSHVPKHRIGDVVLIDPIANKDFPIGLNICHNVPEDDHADLANLIAQIFQSLYANSWGPQLHQYVLQSSRVMLAADTGTLLAVNFLLQHEPYRHLMLAQVSDPSVRIFWKLNFEEHMSDRDRRSNTLSTLNKFEPLLSNPLIRNMLGQSRLTIDIPSILKHKKLLFVCLAELDDNEAKLTASLLLGLIHHHAKKQNDFDRTVHANNAHAEPFTLYLDDAHRYSTHIVERLLSSGSDATTPIVIAHNHISQLPDIAPTLLASASVTVAFRLSVDDAKKLKSKFTLGENLDTELEQLDDHQAYFARSVSTELLHALPLDDERARSRSISAAYTIARNFYGTPRHTVEHRINKFVSAIERGAFDQRGKNIDRTQHQPRRFHRRPRSRRQDDE